MALPDPITRKEMYLNKAATGSGSVPPEPVTREEMYLAEIANGGGSGYTVEETRTVIIPEQTVTTESMEDSIFRIAVLAFADGITVYPKAGDTLSITINGETKDVVGVKSNLDLLDGPIFYFSGSLPDDLPVIAVAINNAEANSEAGLATVGLPTATYTISAELVTRTMTVSPEFQEARGYTSEERVTLVPEGTYTFSADGGDGAGWAYGLDFSSVPDMDFDSPPESVMIVVDGVEYEKQYNASESESSGYSAAIYGTTDIATNDCALLIELNFLRQGITEEAIVPIVRLNVIDGEEQHTVSAYFIKQPVTTTPDFDAAVAKITEPLVVPMTFTNPVNPLAGGTYDSAYYDKMHDAFTEGRQIMLEVPTMGQLQIINVGSAIGNAVFNCMTMAYLANKYLLIVINLDKDGDVNVAPFALTLFSP